MLTKYHFLIPCWRKIGVLWGIMKRLKITPVKHAQSGRWQVRIPVKLSGTGKRETKYFPTKAEAMGYITNLEDVAAGLRLGKH